MLHQITSMLLLLLAVVQHAGKLIEEEKEKRAKSNYSLGSDTNSNRLVTIVLLLSFDEKAFDGSTNLVH